jgi:hypothetical protein
LDGFVLVTPVKLKICFTAFNLYRNVKLNTAPVLFDFKR